MMAERIVKKEITAKEKLVRVLYVIFAILAIIIVNFLPLLFDIGYLFLLTGALSFGIGFVCYLMATGFYKEFEYCVVNDEFSIDVIKAKTRRSALFSGSY